MTLWIMTYTGRRFTPFEPRAEDVNIVDIAHALANTCRYGGHCSTYYSVAEHSVRLARMAPADLAFEALMHDAAEAYLGDLPRPIKRSPLLDGWRQAEAAVEAAIGARFAVRLPMGPEVASLDSSIILDEWAKLMVPTDRDIGVVGAPLGVEIEGWDPWRARREFLAAFDALKPEGAA